MEAGNKGQSLITELLASTGQLFIWSTQSLVPGMQEALNSY